MNKDLLIAASQLGSIDQNHTLSILITVCICGGLMLAGCRGDYTDSKPQTVTGQIESPTYELTEGEDASQLPKTETIPPTLERVAPTLHHGTVASTSESTEPSPDHEVQTELSSGSIKVDHNSVALFDTIPEEHLQGAADLNMFFMDRSVGYDINDGLECLNYPSDEDAPSRCNRYEHEDPTFSASPSDVDWSRPGGYDRSNWDFQSWDQPGCDEWYGKVRCFLDVMDSSIDQYNVVSFQFSYLAVGSGSTIEDKPGGFFWDNPDRLDVYDLEAYEAQHPDKIFFYWTTSLARSIGTEESEIFNQQMRDYTEANGKILFDVADILSHDLSGNLCYDNRDGVPYEKIGGYENHPDDGIDRLAICQQYTTNVDGGHLYTVATGKIRVAKAFWVLMAQIAGWN